MKNMMQNAYHHLQTCKTLHKLPTSLLLYMGGLLHAAIQKKILQQYHCLFSLETKE